VLATVTTPGGTYRDVRIPLLGVYQADNAALAVASIDALRSRGWDISDGALRDGLARTRWPGRLEVIARDPIVLVDGAHNPAGLERSLEAAQKLAKSRPLVIANRIGFALDGIATPIRNGHLRPLPIRGR